MHTYVALGWACNEANLHFPCGIAASSLCRRRSLTVHSHGSSSIPTPRDINTVYSRPHQMVGISCDDQDSLALILVHLPEDALLRGPQRWQHAQPAS